MAYDYFAVAIRWHEGNYTVAAKLENVGRLLDWKPMTAAYPLNDVTEEGSGYVDRATVLPAHRFRQFAKSSEVDAWLDGAAKGANFIMLHQAEWESGLAD